MSTSKFFMGLAVVLALTFFTGAAFGARTAEMPPPPHRLHLFDFCGICADDRNLYVMADGKIFQFGISSLELVKSVDLPEPPLPSRAPPEDMGPGRFPPQPPPMPGPHGLWVGNGSLYVLAGPVVYRYATSGLSLEATVELPIPELDEPELDEPELFEEDY